MKLRPDFQTVGAATCETLTKKILQKEQQLDQAKKMMDFLTTEIDAHHKQLGALKKTMNQKTKFN